MVGSQPPVNRHTLRIPAPEGEDTAQSASRTLEEGRVLTFPYTKQNLPHGS